MEEIAARLLEALHKDPPLHALLQEHVRDQGLDLEQVLGQWRAGEIEELFFKALQDVRIAAEDEHREVEVRYAAVQHRMRGAWFLVAVSGLTALLIPLGGGPRLAGFMAIGMLALAGWWLRSLLYARAELLQSQEHKEITSSGYHEARRRLQAVRERLQKRSADIPREAYLEEVFAALFPTSPEALPAFETWNIPQRHNVEGR